MTDAYNWLIAWFEQRGKISGEPVEGKLSLDYFNAGLIDSLGVIELITEIENHFKISFNETHFQDRRFSTIRGLSEIITEISISNTGGQYADKR